MKDQLVDYMIEINKDPELMAKHKVDAKKAAEDFGLNADDIKLITDKNNQEIEKRCLKSGAFEKNAININFTY